VTRWGGARTSGVSAGEGDVTAARAAEPPGPPAERRRGPGRNLPAAIATGLALVAVLFGALLLDPRAFVVALFALVVATLVELLRVLQRRRIRVAAPVVYAVAAILVLGSWRAGTPALSFGILVALLAGFAWYLLDRARSDVTRGLAVSVFACVYVPFAAAHLVLVVRETPAYVGAIFGYAVLVSGYDTIAYAVGASMGRRRLAPQVSPAKSVEGAVGASVATLALGGLLLPLWSPWTVASGLTMAVLTCVVAPIGDLAESMLKRDLTVKDIGFLLPGHGGFLDRIDALLLTAPVLYYVLALFRGA
jgi:phosphatidate cytidylyltransferase